MNQVNSEVVGLNVAGSRHEVNDEEAISDVSSAVYMVTPYRWLVLTTVFLVNLINAAFWLTYSVVVDDVAKHYDVSENVVNILSMCMSGLYGPVVWTAAPLVKRIGFCNSVRLAALFTCAGGALRYMGQSPSTFFLVVIGQCVSGLARPVISQLLGLVSLQWFAGKQRTLATAIAALGNPFGIGLAFMLSPSIAKGPGDVVKLNFVTMCLGILMLAFVLAFVRERPETDPSAAATAAREGNEKGSMTYLDELKLLKNREYWLLSFAFGLAFGQTNAIAIMLNNLLTPFGYPHTAIGICGVMVILPGIIGAGLIAGYLGKNPMHREALIGIYVAGAAILVAFFVLACRTGLPDYNGWLFVLAAVFGFFAQPCFSIAIELGCEVVYPASPAVGSAGVVMCAQYVGLIVSAVFGAYINAAPDNSKEQQNRVHITGYVMAGCWVIAAMMMTLFKTDNMARSTFEAGERVRLKQAKMDAKRASRSASAAQSGALDDDDDDVNERQHLITAK